MLSPLQRVIWFAACNERDGIGITQAVEIALVTVKNGPHPECDVEALRRDMRDWLEQNAIAKADGTWTLLPAADRLFQELNKELKP